MTATTRYPAISDDSLKTLVAAKPDETLSPELVARATGSAENFAAILADLDKAHLIDKEGFTPLALRFADMWRKFLIVSAEREKAHKSDL